MTGPPLAVVHPLPYMMSYHSVAHKSIRGSITFFSQDVELMLDNYNFHSNAMNNLNAYVVLADRFTTEQRNIIIQWCLIEVENMKTVFNWLKQNNCHYVGMVNMDNCPEPQNCGRSSCTNNTDQSGNSNA